MSKSSNSNISRAVVQVIKQKPVTCCVRVLDVSLVVRKAALQAAQDSCQAAVQAAAIISVQPIAADALTAYMKLAESLCSLLAMAPDSASADQQQVSLCLCGRPFATCTIHVQLLAMNQMSLTTAGSVWAKNVWTTMNPTQVVAEK